MKQAVIAPSMMYLLYPLQSELEGYTREEFIKDLVNEVSQQNRAFSLLMMQNTKTSYVVRKRYSRML